MPASTRRRKAFTLVELIITIVVVSILGLVGAVGFNAVNSRQQRSATQGDLTAVREAELRFASIYDTFTDFPADLIGLPKDVTVTADMATAQHVVSVAIGSDGTLGLSARAPDGTCSFMTVPAQAEPGDHTAWTIPDGAVCEGRAAIPEGEYPLTPSPTTPSSPASKRW